MRVDYPQGNSLTKEEIKLLKQSERTVFRLQRHSDYNNEITSCIECEVITKGRQKKFTEHIPILVSATVIDWDVKTENLKEKSEKLKSHSNFFFYGFSKGESRYQTILSVLRTGDEITLEWTRNVQHKDLELADFVTDKLYFIIERTTPSRKQKKFSFLLEERTVKRLNVNRICNYGKEEYEFKSKAFE